MQQENTLASYWLSSNKLATNKAPPSFKQFFARFLRITEFLSRSFAWAFTLRISRDFFPAVPPAFCPQTFSWNFFQDLPRDSFFQDISQMLARNFSFQMKGVAHAFSAGVPPAIPKLPLQLKKISELSSRGSPWTFYNLQGFQTEYISWRFSRDYFWSFNISLCFFRHCSQKIPSGVGPWMSQSFFFGIYPDPELTFLIEFFPLSFRASQAFPCSWSTDFLQQCCWDFFVAVFLGIIPRALPGMSTGNCP